MEDSDFIEVKKLNIPEIKKETPVVPVESLNVIILILVFILGVIVASIGIFALITTGTTTQFLSDTDCNLLIENATNESFTYGIYYGMDYSLAVITEEIIQCNQIPIDYSNYSYTLIAAECLGGSQDV